MGKSAASPKVLIVMGSDNDFETMKSAVEMLRRFEIPCEVRVCSAHRTPDVAHRLSSEAHRRGVRVIIAGAGAAAHLAGVMAASSICPVIGVPIDSSPLAGVDALYSTAQMPGGVPVAAMAVGKAGAKNAGLFAVQILAVADERLAAAYAEFKAELAREVAAKDATLQKELERG
jgi:5-(carboxyamino)imidazole ribonucleotide mutase